MCSHELFILFKSKFLLNWSSHRSQNLGKIPLKLRPIGHLCLSCLFNWFQTRSDQVRVEAIPWDLMPDKSLVATETLSRSLSCQNPWWSYDLCCRFRTGYFRGQFQEPFARPSRAEISLPVAYSHELHHLSIQEQSKPSTTPIPVLLHLNTIWPEALVCSPQQEAIWKQWHCLCFKH